MINILVSRSLAIRVGSMKVSIELRHGFFDIPFLLSKPILAAVEALLQHD
jgi:hypothetical protein